MDHSSLFFYALEKRRGAKKHVTCLLAEDGTSLTDLEEMRGRARAFYLLLRFWLHFSPHLFLFAHPIRGPTKSRDLLVNLLLALAKVSIYKTRRRTLDEGVLCDCGAYFRSSLVSRVQAEFH
ncbi:unnamed protein product [Lepidochelys kempii]